MIYPKYWLERARTGLGLDLAKGTFEFRKRILKELTMHDIDRTQRELELESHEFEHEHELEQEHEHEHAEALGGSLREHEHENEAFLGALFGEAEHEQEHEYEHEQELEYEQEHELEQEAESPLSESQEMELASELLEVSNEAELEQFLGGLFKKVVRGAGKFVRSPQGKALGGLLKGFAKKALPVAGTALGGFFGGPLGAKIGGGLGRVATNLFELELEGLSHEDREFEVARQFVRLGAAAARTASRMPRMPPRAAARRAFLAAARSYAPGLLRRGGVHPSARHRHAAGCRTCRAMRGRGLQGRTQRNGSEGWRPNGSRAQRPPAPNYASPGYAEPAHGGSGYGGAEPAYAEPTAPVPASNQRAGRWIRRGNKVVLLGL